MAQLSDDCFAFGGQLMPLDQALATIAERAVPLPARRSVALRAARGAILAADIAAPRDVPPHDNSAVDGYAVFHDDLSSEGETVLPVAGRAAAGHPFPRVLRRGEALRIFTGAPMPEGPDTVFMQEDCFAEGGGVRLPAGLKKGANRRRAGEDVRAGDIVLRAGLRLRPQEVGLAASLGLVELPVYAPLKVAVLSTGDEVREPGAALPPGGIYDANRYALMSLVEALGCEATDLGIVEDRLPPLRDALEKAAAGHDLIVTSGGMSTGEEDHMKAAVEALGRLYFWRLAIKPGRPVALGQVGRVPLIGLPGNPVAVMVTFLLLARPLILRLAGASVAEPRSFPVRAEFDYRKKAGRREFVRASLGVAVGGLPAARRFPRDGAGILSSMTQSDGLVVLGEEITRVAPGDAVPFLPFAELLS
jgi:molybdopterin molybdotransferase